MIRLLSLVLMLLLTASTVAAPPMGLEQRIEPQGEPVPFGKSVKLILTLRYPSDAEVPAAETIDIPGAHVLDRFQVQGPQDGTNSVMEYHLVFTRLEPGLFKVPALKVGGASSRPMEVEFVGAQPLESDKPGEIRGPKNEEALSTADFWKQVLLWLAGILLAAGLLTWLFNRLGIVDRWRSPKGRALKRLKRLQKQHTTAESLLIGCVEILRSYLHEAYGFTTAESTSREILNQMTMDNRCRDLRGSVQGVLEAGDAVKFARRDLTESEASDHYENLVNTLRVEPKVKS